MVFSICINGNLYVSSNILIEPIVLCLKYLSSNKIIENIFSKEQFFWLKILHTHVKRKLCKNVILKEYINRSPTNIFGIFLWNQIVKVNKRILNGTPFDPGNCSKYFSELILIPAKNSKGTISAWKVERISKFLWNNYSSNIK